MQELGRPCVRCDELLDECVRLREKLAAAREEASERRWERDHAIEAYHRVRDELLRLQASRG